MTVIPGERSETRDRLQKERPASKLRRVMP